MCISSSPVGGLSVVGHDHALNLNISTQAIACAMYYGRE